MKFSQFRNPPPNRQGFCDGNQECHLTEAAVMIAFAFYLLKQGATQVDIHPDGEHGKAFDIKQFLEAQGFVHVRNIGKTAYGGLYQRDHEIINVTLVPGLGDVEANLGGQKIVAECKGGIINTRHSGQVSRLRRGLCEATGLLMTKPLNNDRQIVVVPATKTTQELAQRMIPRAMAAGIEIALVTENGQVAFIESINT